MSQEQKLLPVEHEQVLLDRPTEERLRDELDKRDHADARPPRSAVGAANHPPDEEPKPTAKWLMVALLIGLVVIAVFFFIGYLPRRSREQATAQSARREAESLPVVNVVQVKRSPEFSRLLLPGDITPVTEAPIYARASGYIIKRFVDIGDRVQAQQLMAVIEAPDLDQQVSQGRSQVAQAQQQLGQTQAALEQTQAQLELARVTWDRYRTLVTDGAVSKQDADTQKANFDTGVANVNSSKANVRAAEDNVRAAQANLDRLISLQSYKDVRAPFAGVVTVRNVDVGTYISTSGGQSGSTTYGASQSLGSTAAASSQNGEMFRVAQIDRLRILINVPQTDAPSVHVGQNADVLVAEYVGRRFPGVVTRTASSLDPTTRTLLTEVQVDNHARSLLPGMYAEVQFRSARTSPPILVPGDSLISNADGVYIAVLVDPDPQKLQALRKESPEDNGTAEHKEKPKQIHMEKVEVGRDYGTATEITSGLQGWEYVAANPSDQVFEGALILPTTAKGSQAAAPAGGNTDKHPSGSGGETSAGAPPNPQGGAASATGGSSAGAAGKSGK